MARTANRRTGIGIALWILQWLLALLFLFAGGAKLVMPIEEMTRQIALPGWFLRIIGVAEILGGLGLVLPGLLKLYTWLTPLAAASLVVIMIGATIVSAMIPPAAGALFPFATGVLLLCVAYGRWRGSVTAQN